MNRYTTVRITKEQKKRLDDIGKKADTHADIIGRLIEEFEKNNKKRRR